MGALVRRGVQGVVVLAVAAALGGPAAALSIASPVSAIDARSARSINAAKESPDTLGVIRVRVSSRGVAVGGVVRLSGDAPSVRSGVRLSIQRRSGRSWKRVGSGRVSRSGRFSVRFRVRSPGSHALRVAVSGRASGPVVIVGLARRSAKSSGGRVSAALAGATVSAPAGAIKRGETLRVSTTTASGPAGPSLAGGPFELSTSQGQPSKPVTVTVRYDPAALARGESPVLLHREKNGKKWVAEQATIDPKRRTITATIDSFSLIDVASAVTWFGGVITSNRRDLPGDCGSPPTWIDGVSFPKDRNDALPSCVSRETTDQTLKINVVNNRGYAQLVTILGAEVDADRSRWSTSLEGQLASAFTRVASGGGPREFLLAPGASATLAIQRPQGILGSRVVSIQAAAVHASSVTPLVWSFLKEANKQVGSVGALVGVAECIAKYLHVAATSTPGAAQTLSAVKRCSLSAASLKAVKDTAKAQLKKLAAGLFVTDFFYRLIDLNAQDAYPARISFAFRGTNATDPDIRPQSLDLGTVPAGTTTIRRMTAGGGVAPYFFGVSTVAINKGRKPEWITLASDGTITLNPPVDTNQQVSFYIVVIDANGRSSPSARDEVQVTIAAPSPTIPAGGIEITMSPARAGFAYTSLVQQTSCGFGLNEAVASGLPAGLVLNTNGYLIGVPSGPGTISFTATWDDCGTKQSARVTLPVESGQFSVPDATSIPNLGITVGESQYPYVERLRRSPSGRFIAVQLWPNNSIGILDTSTGQLTLADLSTDPNGSGFGTGGWSDNLAWSPDSRYLAFTSQKALLGRPQNWPWYNVYVYDTMSGGLTRITDGSNGHSFNAVWSPDGRTIAFNQELTNAGPNTGKPRVVLHDWTTGQERAVPCPGPCEINTTYNDFSTEPWSADSRFLTMGLLDRPPPNGPDVPRPGYWDSATDTVTELGGSHADARPSPDGFRVIVLDWADGSPTSGDGFIIDLRTGIRTTLPDGIVGKFSVYSGHHNPTSAWSPSGKFVAGELCDNGCRAARLDTDSMTLVDRPLPARGNWPDGWKGDTPLWCRSGASDQLSSCWGISPAGDAIATEAFPGLPLEITASGVTAQVFSGSLSGWRPASFVAFHPWAG